MKTYFALFSIATLASLILTPVVRRLCQRFKLLDVPADGRRIHKQAIPRLGGVAIFSAIVIPISLLPLVSNAFTQALGARVPELLIVLIPTSLVLLLGIYDDLRGANAKVKFLGLGIVAAIFFYMGGRIDNLALPYLGVIHFHPVVAFFITVFWLVGIANAFNLIDGMDGLAPGTALFSAIVILLIALANGNPLTITIALVLCGALVGFLRYNFNPASIFMGDSGSLSVGFMLAALSVVGVQKASTAVAVITPILAFGLPVVDTSVTVARRLISGRPIFAGDSEHIHHMLLARGWSQRHVALVLYGVCAAFGLVATIFTKTSSPVMGVVLFVMAVTVVIGVGQLRYHEMDEIRAGVRRNVGDRRIRVANNIRVRRSSLAVSKAQSLADLLQAISQLLEFGEFVHAELRLGKPGNAETNERVLAQASRTPLIEAAYLSKGYIAWCWNRGDIEAEEILGSHNFWSVRLPLSNEGGDWGWITLYRPFAVNPLLVDINYLSDIFRRELSEAAERILTSHEAPVSSRKLGLSVSAGKLTN